MEIIKYIGQVVADRRDSIKRTNEAYEQAYQRCFEGTPDEVERKLYVWDEVHRTTRSYPRS